MVCEGEATVATGASLTCEWRQMSSFGNCSQVGEALVLLFWACRSSPVSTRLETGLMVVQIDSTVFQCAGAVACLPGCRCCVCFALLSSCMLCGARYGLPFFRFFARFFSNRPSSLYSF